jgi:DNA polymerase-3 subunit delta
MAAAQKRATRSPASNGPTWRDVTPAGVVLVGGPEEYLGIRAMDRVRAQVRAASPDVEVSRINASSYEAGTLLMQVSPSLFGESKLIEVEAVEAMNDAFLADALAYLGHPEPDAVLVLRHGGGARGKKLLDAVKKGGWPVVDCQPLKKDADKVAFVASEFKAGGRRIEPDAVQALVNAVGANLSELAAACSQLIADAGTTVTTDIVDRYYGGRIEATAFKVADAAMAGTARWRCPPFAMHWRREQIPFPWSPRWPPSSGPWLAWLAPPARRHRSRRNLGCSRGWLNRRSAMSGGGRRKAWCAPFRPRPRLTRRSKDWPGTPFMRWNKR